ncbi:hypothetical protein LTR62_008156 [Meristemomyces frigidus]|uniref:Zn(2)-C6 fungal-type domain-containing protein n=1 Tax=Meristemomyces frigidus TaxID=1508187 RepID=A0AAN7YNG3_9PEZI|nr:hypothetical protein LTR62_008156 [Meristemomyces frigidus]
MAVDDFDAATLMPLETPPLKVSRPVAACSRCRNAKIKCDGKLPACSSCEKTGRAAECINTNDEFARGKERSYVSTLETKIDRLQAKLQEAHARKPSVVSIPDDETAAPSRRPSYSVQEPHTPITTKAQRRKENSAIDDLVGDFAFLSVNATARDFYGFTNNMSYARLVMSACTKDPLPQGTTKALPARHVAAHLIRHYHHNVFTLLPVFDEATFYTSVDMVYTRNSADAEPLDFWMVHMILAIGNASMSEQRGDQHYLEGIGHVCAALEHAEDVLQPGAISSVQALVLLTQYAMLDPHHLDSWSLIGAASRAMVDLGLHQDPPKGAPMFKSKLELRRRVFYCVFALDRSTSLVQTRAFSFGDDSTKVKIPFAKLPPGQQALTSINGQSATWLQSNEHALDLILLRQLQSIWYTDLFQSGRERWQEPYPYIWNACDTLRRWFDNLSPSISRDMHAFFELDLLYSYVYVLSPSPRVPNIDAFAAKLIFEYCIQYAALMLRLICDPSYTAPMTFYDAMRVYMTGRQFLDVLNHGTEPLLSGHMPPHPPVRPSTAAPPQVPRVVPPPGDNMAHFNTVRSVNCIKQVTECLTKFGMRWGYMSWSQRYQAETVGMLELLNQRMREMQSPDPSRRPSMWPPHASSSGSIHSASGSMGGSVQYSTPPNLPIGPAAYTQRQGSITAYSMSNYGDHMQMAPTNPPTHPYSSSPFHHQPVQHYDHQQPTQPVQTFNFDEPSTNDRRHNSHAAPSMQFAGWSGYGGPSAPDTLDEENATGRPRLQDIAPFAGPSDEYTSPSDDQKPGTSIYDAIQMVKRKLENKHRKVSFEKSAVAEHEQQLSRQHINDNGADRSSRGSIVNSLRSIKGHLVLDNASHRGKWKRRDDGGKSSAGAPRQSIQLDQSSAAPVSDADMNTLQTGLSLGGIGILPNTDQAIQAKSLQSTESAQLRVDYLYPPSSTVSLAGRSIPKWKPNSMHPSAKVPAYARRKISMSDIALEFQTTFERKAVLGIALTRSESPQLPAEPRQLRERSHEPEGNARGKQPAYLLERETQPGVAYPPSQGGSSRMPIDLTLPAPASSDPSSTLPAPSIPAPDLTKFIYIPGTGFSCRVCNMLVPDLNLHSSSDRICFVAEKSSAGEVCWKQATAGLGGDGRAQRARSSAGRRRAGSGRGNRGRRRGSRRTAEGVLHDDLSEGEGTGAGNGSGTVWRDFARDAE